MQINLKQSGKIGGAIRRFTVKRDFFFWPNKDLSMLYVTKKKKKNRMPSIKLYQKNFLQLFVSEDRNTFIMKYGNENKNRNTR